MAALRSAEGRGSSWGRVLCDGQECECVRGDVARAPSACANERSRGQ